MKTNKLFAMGLLTAIASGACGGDDGGKQVNKPDAGPTMTLADGAVVPAGDGGGGGQPGVDGGNGNGGDGGGLVGGSGTGLITSVGGTVTSADGVVSVKFARSTYSRPTTVTVAPATNPPAGAKGTVYNIGPAGELISDGYGGGSVFVTFKYTDADLGGGSPSEVIKLGQYINGAWTEATLVPTANTTAPVKIDPTAKTITVQLHSLGPIALIGGLCVTCPQTTCAKAGDVCTSSPDAYTMNPGHCELATPTATCLKCVADCDDDKDGYCGGQDCEPTNPAINAGAVELCNGRDDNCNFHTDEGCTACKADADCTASGEACINGVCSVCSNANCSEGASCALDQTTTGVCHQFGVKNTCSGCYSLNDKDFDGQSATAVPPSTDKDCNDADPKVNGLTTTPEICGNNIDDNCNGKIDELCATCTNDGECPRDGQFCQGNVCVDCPAACDATACAASGAQASCQPYGKSCSRCIRQCDLDMDGYCQVDGGDCDESDPGKHRDALEICNGKDDNCDGHTDEGCTACASDADCKGFPEYCNERGVCDSCQTCAADTCKFPQYPQNASETQVAGTCRSFGKGCGVCTPPGDMDQDGYLPNQAAVAAILAKAPTANVFAGDCDDTNFAVHSNNPQNQGAPTAHEICGNMVDDDCNGQVDELCNLCDTSAMCAPVTVCDNSR